MDDTRLSEFFAAFQSMVLDPDTFLLDEETLDHRFKSLVQKVESETGSIPDDHTSQAPVTFAIFGPQKNGPTQPISNHAPNKRLKVCRLKPDELLQGWRGRMHTLNCLTDKTDLDRLITEIAVQQNGQLQDEKDVIECAAIILGETKEILIRNHTLIPFSNTIEGRKPNKLGNTSVSHRQAYDRHAPFRIGGRFPRYCQQCVEEDLAALGYSYWRCSHQLPGLIWCPRHKDTFLSVHTIRQANLPSPHQLSDSNIDDRVYSLSENQASIIKRHSAIAYEIHNHAYIIDSAAASRIFGKRAKALDLRISRAGKRTTLSTYVMQSLPDWWLKETFERVQWAPNKFIPTIDGACTTGERYTTATLCMLAGLFYEDVDEAIIELLKPRDMDKIRGFDLWASKEMFDEYIAQQGNVSRIAQRLSMPHSTVGVGLLNQGLPGLGKSSSAIIATHVFLAGQSLQEASVSNGTSTEEIEGLVRAACAKFKTALDAMLNKISISPQPTLRYDKRQASG